MGPALGYSPLNAWFADQTTRLKIAGIVALVMRSSDMQQIRNLDHLTLSGRQSRQFVKNAKTCSDP